MPFLRKGWGRRQGPEGKPSPLPLFRQLARVMVLLLLPSRQKKKPKQDVNCSEHSKSVLSENQGFFFFKLIPVKMAIL